MSRQADTSDGMTQQQVAEALGISLARVGQLERSAFRKLKGRPKVLAEMREMAKMLDMNRRDENTYTKALR